MNVVKDHKFLTSIIFVSAIIIIGSVGFMFYALADCLTTGCVNTDDHEHEGLVRNLALTYSKADCKKSYDSVGCESIGIESAYFNCGFMGQCGWLLNLKAASGDTYTSGMFIENIGPHDNYEVTQYDENTTPYTAKLRDIFMEMCNDYEPTKKLGCDPFYIEPTIDWLGNNNKLGDPNEGVAISYVNPYEFKTTIDRRGHVREAVISNYETNIHKPLFTYDISK